jgi:Predicted transcriptional regulators
MFVPLIYDGNRISSMMLMILLSVRKERRYGYEILKELRDQFEGVWEPKTGAIYPAIKRLQEMELLDSEEVGSKEYYSLSEKGHGWIIKTMPEIYAMSDFNLKFMNVVADTSKEMGIEQRNISDIRNLPAEEKLEFLINKRNLMESEVKRLNKKIDELNKEE